MPQNLINSQIVDVDTDTGFDDVLWTKEYEDFNQPLKVPPTAKRPTDDDGLLDLSDESTLDKLSSGGFLRIRPEGQNVVSVAFFKPAVQAKTHYSAEQNYPLPPT